MSASEEKAALADLGRSGHDPRSAAEFLAALETEAEQSLRNDPSRWRSVQATSPDHHRRRARRQPWRAAP